MLAEFAAVEDAVMADAFLHVMLAFGSGQAFTDFLRGFGLADAGDVVQLAFEREQGGLGDELGLDFLAFINEFAFWQQMALEYLVDAIEVEFGW